MKFPSVSTVSLALTVAATTVVDGFTPQQLPLRLQNRVITAPSPIHDGIRRKKNQHSALVLSTVALEYLSQEQQQRSIPVVIVQKFRNLLSSAALLRGTTNEVALWRAAAVTFVSTLLLCRHAIDAQLVLLWTHLTISSSLAARVFRTDSYEWCLAVAAFGVYIHFFGYADRAVRKAATAVDIAANIEQGHSNGQQQKQHPWRKYRLQDRFEADKHRRMIERRVVAGMEVTANDLELPAVKQSPWHWKAWIFEFWVYVLPLVTWDILSPRRHRRLAAFGAPTTLKIMGDVAGGLLLYDLLFFCGHFLMHKVPLFYKLIHRKHHKIEEVRACEQVRLSLGEEVLDVGFSIIALNVLGAHPISRSIYNLIIVFLLTELHSGFDFPWTPQNVMPFGIATGSRRHHYHHRFGQHYYQKFFFTVDRLFGFFQKDDNSLKGDSVTKDPYIPSSWKSS